VKGESLRFSEEGVKHALRHLLIPLWNSYSFFVTYANVDKWEPGNSKLGESENLLDRWIESSLANLCQEVTAAMDNYDLQRAVRPFVTFIEDLTNWYIRRSRRRFWKSEDDGDKQQAYTTLYHVLIELCKIAAPFTPFIAEEIYRNLTGNLADCPESVHFCDFPSAAGARRNPELEQQMRIVMDVVVMGRQLRKDHDAKVRQPLRRFDVVSRDSALLNQVGELKQIIAEELNVREVVFDDDESGLATLSAKANFKTLGRKFGKQVQAINQAVQKLSGSELHTVASGNGLSLSIGGETFELAAEDILVERIPKEGLAVQSQGALVVALDLELDDDLIREGLARELVNNVQQLRKTTGLDVTDRIHLKISSDEAVSGAVAAFKDYIKAEVLALSLETAAREGEPVDLNGHACVIAIEKA
ncbi:MAG: DUF5915 domain-containing protein, partial [Pontiellaceae bacterium]|nr:DUF5915 domain-containing protein [Pontiellaceae bacterium]